MLHAGFSEFFPRGDFRFKSLARIFFIFLGVTLTNFISLEAKCLWLQLLSQISVKIPHLFATNAIILLDLEPRRAANTQEL